MIKAADLIALFWQAINEKWGYIWGMTHVMWSETRQENYVKAYSKDPDRANSCKYGGKWAGHWVTDCSGLFAWAYSKYKTKIAHGSNSIYDSYCKAKGKLTNGRKQDGSELMPGTAVFTTNDAGRHNHIGLYVGDGTVIEAMGAQNGCVTSKVTAAKWKAWGELKDVSYDGQPAEDPAGKEDEKVDDNYPTVRRGNKNKYVTLMQVKLLAKGYDLGKWGADGDFGQATEAAVKAFQRDNGLTADGICGPKTWAKLLEDGNVNDPEKDPTYRVIIKGLDLAQAKALCNNYPGSTMEEE